MMHVWRDYGSPVMWRPENTAWDKIRNVCAGFNYWCYVSRVAYWATAGFWFLLGGETMMLAPMLLAEEKRLQIPCAILGGVLLVWAVVLGWRFRRWYICKRLSIFDKDILI